ncbi:MAG TPA: tail fiber domain-containing protein, partial [Alphaproteobacteria bacterium]|nr:tail fiber domain-containing protein [Alphaproteobacteria bacterium]
INTTNTNGQALWVEGSGVINTNIGNANAANVNAFSITGTQYAAGSGNFNTLAVFPNYNNGGSYSGITGVLSTPYVNAGTLTNGVTGVYATPTVNGGNISGGAFVTGLMAHPTTNVSISGGVIGVEGITYGGYAYGDSRGGTFGCAGTGALCYGLYIGNYGGSYGTRYALYINDSSPSIVGGWMSVGHYGNPGYALHVNGFVYASGGAGGLSDRRHKKDIVPYANGALEQVMKLKPVTFNWKKPTDDAMKGRQMGFIAQDIQQVLPDAIVTMKNEEHTLVLKYESIIPVLAKAMQEQQAMIEKFASSVVSSVKTALKDMGIWVENGITRIAALAVDTFTVGSAEKPSGITLYDEDTRQPYCVKIKGGKMVNLPGACGVLKTSAAH